MALLEPALLARLERLQLGTHRRLAGHLSGDHRSVRHGSSLDFADYRPYYPGDDFRRIDYHLLARLDVLLLKLFEAEDEIRLRLLIDTSASMARGKLACAIRLAAALGFVALVHRDPVTVHTFPLERATPRFCGKGAAPALFAHLSGLAASGDTRFAAAAGHLVARPGPAGMTVIISDLLTLDWRAGLDRLPARGAEVVVIHVLAEEDLRPDLIGDYDLIDAETGARVPVSLSPEALSAYVRGAAAWAEELASRCRQVGAAYLRVMADDDLEALLLGHWQGAGVLR